MAEVNVASKLSFGELAKRLDPTGASKPIYEAMNEVNPVFPFIPAKPASHQFHHQATRRTSLPTATWRQFYSGTSKKASTTQVVRFPVGLLEIWSEIDEDLVDTAADPQSVRRNEDMAFVQGMQQQVMDALIEGTTTSYPERIDGIQQYLNSLSHTMVKDGSNSGGTSIYIVDFSKCYMTYPKHATMGGPTGLDVRTNPTGSSTGKIRVLDTSSNPYMAYATQFKWWVGWVVEDELGMGRVANINPTVGGSNGFDENDLIELLTYGRFNPGSTYILVCKELQAQMQIRAKDKSNVNWDTKYALSGQPVAAFQGTYPVLRCDSISTSEGAVS